MITQQFLLDKFYYENGYLINKTSRRIVGGPNGDGRWKTCINNKYYYIHRLIWCYHYGDCPEIVDHIDRNVSNNKIENLRRATASQSSCNRTEINKTNFRGVDKYNNRWRAKIRFNNVHYHIGYFDTPEEAAEAYQRKAKELHKEFAVFISK